MKKSVTLNRLFLLLLLAIVLPVLFYSGYELSTLSSDEELMASVYRRQLDVILFSLNQYSWDVVNSWAGTIGQIVDERNNQPPDTLVRLFGEFLSRKKALQAIVLSDTAGSVVHVYQNTAVSGGEAIHETAMTGVFRKHTEALRQLLGYLQADYRKIDPFRFVLPGEKEERLALRFIAGYGQNRLVVVTMILNGPWFVREILSPKLRDAAGDEFVLAVFQSTVPLFSTSPLNSEELKERKDLWVLPTYSLGIRTRGTTIDELVHRRFTRNIILIALLDCILVAGAWLVYRNLRREVELVRMKAGFVSTVSHELRTPLSLIRMYAETLEMGRIGTEEKRQQYYTTILRESERLTRLVNNVLSFAKLDAGVKQYHFQKTDLNGIVLHVIEMFKVQLQTVNCIPHVDCSPDLPPINADAEAVSEMIINIIDNAIKYSREDKYLRITTGTEKNHVVLAVEDHGIGIAAEHQQRIFEQFYRVSDGLVHDVKGSGLGLALVRHCMNAHRGTIRVTSTPGKGSTFRLFFPVMNG